MRTFEEINTELFELSNAGDLMARRNLIQEMLELGTAKGEATALFFLGLADNQTGDYSAAIEYFRRAFAVYEEIGDRAGMVNSLKLTGQALMYTGDNSLALQYLRQALMMCEEEGDRNTAASVIFAIGNVYCDTGDFASALEQYSRGLTVSQELSNRKGVADGACNIGIVYFNMKNYASALEHFRRALTVYEELGLLCNIALTIANIGNVYCDTGDYPSAVEYHRRAIALHEELGEGDNVVWVTGSLIVDMLCAGKYEEAAEILEQQATMTMESAVVRSQHESSHAALAEYREDLEKANEHLQQALAIVTEANQRVGVAYYHERLRNLAQKRNDFASYIEHNDEYLRITEEIRGAEATQKVALQESDRKMEGERREREKERALLYGALPESVANRMLRGEDVSGDQIDHASVMFLDVVGFTTNSHDLEPRVVTELLDDVFNTFDELCDKHNVTKIKTIGDAYLAVAFPTEDHSTEKNIASVALAIQQLQFTWPDNSPLQFRIGLHSGPVVAGVIGKQRLQYDVWGDTVNVASRMESTSEPNRIQVSDAFAATLRATSKEAIDSDSDLALGTWHLALRGETEVKGKGTMKTFWLEGM